MCLTSWPPTMHPPAQSLKMHFSCWDKNLHKELPWTAWPHPLGMSLCDCVITFKTIQQIPKQLKQSITSINQSRLALSLFWNLLLGSSFRRCCSACLLQASQVEHDQRRQPERACLDAKKDDAFEVNIQVGKNHVKDRKVWRKHLKQL